MDEIMFTELRAADTEIDRLLTGWYIIVIGQATPICFYFVTARERRRDFQPFLAQQCKLEFTQGDTKRPI